MKTNTTYDSSQLAQLAKEWLEKNGWKVIQGLHGTWKVRRDRGLLLGDEMLLYTHAELITFARQKGYEVKA